MARFHVVITDLIFANTQPEQEIIGPAGATVAVAPALDEATLCRAVAEADAILTCFAKVTAHIIAAAPRCRVIARYGTGIDNIDVAAASARGIAVCRVPEYCTDEVAEHTLALLLHLARGLGAGHAAVRRGGWGVREVSPLYRVRGKTLGLVGFGKIARGVAERARALGLRVLVAHPRLDPAAATREGAILAPLPHLLSESDFVSLHCPLTEETRGLLRAADLRRMKPTAYLINTARGPLVDESALVTALQERWIAGAALDVLDAEPPPAGRPLLQCPNLLITPHVAFYSEESLVDLQRQASEEVARVLRGERPLHAVNAEVLR